MIYPVTVLVAYLGILSQLAFASPKLACLEYDTELVNGRCEIPMVKIDTCPGTIESEMCITAAEVLN